jgi:hypothetical protein
VRNQAEAAHIMNCCNWPGSKLPGALVGAGTQIKHSVQCHSNLSETAVVAAAAAPPAADAELQQLPHLLQLLSCCSHLPFDISNIVFCISGSLIESLTSFMTSPDFCRVPDTRSMAAQHSMAQHDTINNGSDNCAFSVLAHTHVNYWLCVAVLQV